MPFEQFLHHAGSRRQFLGSSARNAAGMAAGVVGLTSRSASASVDDRVAIGVIGIRAQGKTLATGLAGLPNVRVSAICDVDANLLPVASRSIEAVQTHVPVWHHDFRRILDDPDIDAVVIATPDHWHALMTIHACQAGKDVYVEKPISHNIEEGHQMVAAAARCGTVVQTGLQQRSGRHFQSAIDLIRSGQIGAVRLARAWTVHRRRSIGTKRDSTTPQGVNYDMWLGPAPERPFNGNRFHYSWRWFDDYGTGELGNWGVHMIDIARWGLGVEFPQRVSAVGGKYHFVDDQETPDTLVVNYEFGDRTIVWEHRQWSTHAPEGRSAATAFYGENGTLIVDRSGWKVYDTRDSLADTSSDAANDHLRNFVECMRTRERPAADIISGHMSTSLCHLGHISWRLNREIRPDPTTGVIADPEVTPLLSREYRPRWQLPQV